MSDWLLLALGFVLGLVAAAVVWTRARPVFAEEIFARENYRGRIVPVGAGIVLAVAAVAAEAVFAVLGALDVDAVRATRGPRLLVVLAAVGYGLLGLVDDLAAGAGAERGFAGHLRALTEGRLTTGAVKLLGGGALAVALTGAAHPDGGVGWLIVDALVIALAANLGNLFDRAPGRAAKVALLAFAVLLVATGFDERLVGVAVIAGAALALFVPDLRERLMLGDAGSNVLGATAGLGVVLATGTTTRIVVLVVVAVLNVASEMVSFSRVIDRVPPLRYADRLGRRP
jgi:UDP-N-acetylmuramyl pentapeptide phosphotransferase/UDP-N-acetylglucosamine-1-phosphate transferase